MKTASLMLILSYMEQHLDDSEQRETVAPLIEELREEIAKAQPTIGKGSRVEFELYGVRKHGTVARVANGIVHLTSGRWLHEQSCTLVTRESPSQ